MQNQITSTDKIITQTVIFKNLPKISTNEIYAGKHWRSRKDMKKFYLLATYNEIKKLKPVKNKANLEFIFYFQIRPLDSSNTSYMAKLIEDCLTHYKIIKNDGINFIGRVSFESQKTIDTFDSCKLTITEIL